MPRYTVTVRHGRGGYRYHTSEVDAADLADAMRAAAGELPDDVRGAADLVEIRRAPEPDDRSYLGEEGEEPSTGGGPGGPGHPP